MLAIETAIPKSIHILQSMLLRTQRLNVVRAGLTALTAEECYVIVSELLERLEGPQVPQELPLLGTSVTGALRAAPAGKGLRVLRHGKPTRIDRAEQFIHAHPEGVTLKEIAAVIQQKLPTATSSCRHLQRTRNSIAFRGGKWLPVAGVTPRMEQTAAAAVEQLAAVTAAEAVTATEVATEQDRVAPDPAGASADMSYRDAILAVVQHKALEIGGIHKAIQRFMPSANYRSVAGEVKRMQKKSQLEIVGHGNNGRTYGPPKPPVELEPTKITFGIPEAKPSKVARKQAKVAKKQRLLRRAR